VGGAVRSEDILLRGRGSEEKRRAYIRGMSTGEGLKCG
jgi:hypothetical protein